MVRMAALAAITSVIALGLGLGCSSSNEPQPTNEIEPGDGGGSAIAAGGRSDGSGGASASASGGAAGAVASSSGGATGGLASQSGGSGGVAAAASSAGSGTLSIFPPCDEGFLNLGDCGATATEAQLVPVSIMLIVDKSGSMSFQPAGYPDRKWPTMSGALTAALSQLAPFADFGLVLFPGAAVDIDCEAGSCCALGAGVDVPVQEGTIAVPQIKQALEATGPGGRTPTAAALRVAYDYFASLPAGVEGGTRKRYVVLATDGGPNCDAQALVDPASVTCASAECTVNLDGQRADFPYECGDNGPNNCCDPASVQLSSSIDCLDADDTLAQINALQQLGINTVVIGIPGSEPYAAVLNQFAAAGQPERQPPATYHPVDASDSGQITDIFIDIATNLIKTCDIWLDRPPSSDLVNVAIECEAVPAVENGITNWVLDASTTPTILRLYGALCDEALTQGLGRVDVVFGCPQLG